MPRPRKLDLIPQELQARLKAALEQRGYADIVEVTEELNFWLEDAGLEITIGKSAVGEFSKVLKDQRDAFNFAEVIMKDLDIEGESEMHKAIMQMIAVHAVKLMRKASDDEEVLPAKDLMALGKMLKEVMSSAGIREKMLADDEERVAKKARVEAAAAATKVAQQAGISEETVEAVKQSILGVA